MSWKSRPLEIIIINQKDFNESGSTIIKELKEKNQVWYRYENYEESRSSLRALKLKQTPNHIELRETFTKESLEEIPISFLPTSFDHFSKKRPESNHLVRKRAQFKDISPGRQLRHKELISLMIKDTAHQQSEWK